MVWSGKFYANQNPYYAAQILPGDCVKNLTGFEFAIWLSHLILSSSQMTGVSKKSWIRYVTHFLHKFMTS